VKVASTMEPPRAVIPAALRLWRIFASVVASGTCACMRSACTEALPGATIQDSIFKFSRLKSPNMTCSRYILKLRLYSAHMPATRLRMVAGFYQCNPAIPHNDCIHPLQECLSSGLSLQTLGFKVLKAHLSAHICLLDMLECVDVAIPYPERQIGIYVDMGTAWFETF
jgi:hypothetical protein